MNTPFRLARAMLIGLLIGLAPDVTGQVVAHHPDAAAPFGQRFTWALEQAQRAPGGKAWIGFEITRRMPAGDNFVRIDNWSFYGMADHDRGMTLFELIEGRQPVRAAESDDDNVRRAARHVLEDLGWPIPEEQLADRRVGILLGIDTNAPPSDRWDAMWIGNIEMEMVRRGRTLLWLGTADATDSVPHIRSLLESTTSAEGRERLVSAVGAHTAPEVVVPILAAVLRDDPGADVREEAASWLPSQRSESALTALIRAASHDQNADVREECVDAIARFSGDAAIDALIDRARRDESRNVREQAVEALGRRRSGFALETLSTVAFEDSRRDIQEEAVEAIGRYSDQEKLPVLAKVAANHPSASVREEAVEQIAMSSSSDAVVVLSRVARMDPNSSLQEEALEALMALPDEMGVDAVASIALSHPSQAMRNAAIELVSRSSGARAKDALKRLPNEQ